MELKTVKGPAYIVVFAYDELSEKLSEPVTPTTKIPIYVDFKLYIDNEIKFVRPLVVQGQRVQ